MIALVHPGVQPRSLRRLGNSTEDDQDFYFPSHSSSQAANGWLTHHPGGRLFTTHDFLRRDLLATLNAARIDLNLQRTDTTGEV